MLLELKFSSKFSRIVFPLIALGLSLLGSGCMVSHDADAVAERRVSGRLAGENRDDGVSFAGLRFDHNPDYRRTLRAHHLAGDRRLVPSAKEQRMARAMVEAEARLVRQGGMMLYRWDGSASKPSNVQFVESPGALTVKYRASEGLNSLDGKAHALQLVMYHLSDRAALDQLAGHEEGMRKLLEGERFDASVKRVRTHFVQPGAKGELLLDRPEGGRFVAIVAGFACPEAETSLYVTEYGIGRWETPGSTVWARNKFMFNPLPLEISVSLGRKEMAAKNVGQMTGHLMKTQELLASQVDYSVWSELTAQNGWKPLSVITTGDAID